MKSISYKITGAIFFSVFLTVVLLIYLADIQMTEHFQTYLTLQSGRMVKMNQAHGMMGPTEEAFLKSVHESLIWVGMGLIALGVLLGTVIARGIIRPLQELNIATQKIAMGQLEVSELKEGRDEVGQLSVTFNKMSKSLVENSKLRKRFLADIAHELKTPLAILQGSLEAMLDGLIPADKSNLSSMHEEVCRLDRLIQELKLMSLAQINQIQIKKSLVNVPKWVQKIEKVVAGKFSLKDVTVKIEIDPCLENFEFDEDRMTQIMTNILSNALRHTPTGRLVYVSISADCEFLTSGIHISVRDEGTGFNPEDIPYLFDYFYRSDESRNKDSGGTGMGLAIVKELVRLHGGKVIARNVERGGAEIIIEIPHSLKGLEERR